MTTRSLISSALPLLLVRPQNLTRFRHLSFIVTNAQPQYPKSAFVGTRNHGLQSNFRIMSMSSSASESESTVPKSVHVSVAHELVQAGHRYLDVRTSEEFAAGHPPGAVNVPYLFRMGAGMANNPNFLEEVSKHFGEDAAIVVGCQKGMRSLKAVADLSNAGFSGVIDVAGGYSEWTANGLPTE
ncbi:hypothetical protein C5167_010509 [Papaver somniferum]|uniref:Rhodanese domain-containing protein n=1 Tax=Papaver somniferum TaxID=3469 RepID=A0A4Y7K3I3_PAPSO|nr:thiosulfate sulfurtransferase 16, chloroplastic-like [Papaver somniferum]RZC66821.1 hypothetical protein C5167_010509 [Papaver somniferum]